MRLFPAIVRRMGRSVKGIPSNPLLLARSSEPRAAPEQTGHISGEKNGRARRAKVEAYQSGRGIYQNGIAMAPNSGDGRGVITSQGRLSNAGIK
ncbi:hypothetical protein CF108_13765 [Aeromonas veronii]|nr:hypothetical protein CF108_13765 [Aeromonas veronii]